MHTYAVRRVMRVVDADTIDCRISLGFGIDASLRFRLYGIDTPEVYGRNASEAGHAAAEFVAAWLDEHLDGLTVRSYKGAHGAVGIGDGAFGRWLASFIAADGSTLADALVAAGHVTDYQRS